MISLLSAGLYMGLQEDLDTHPDFRRATRHQKIAFSATNDCVRSYPEWDNLDKSRVGLIVGTNHGELESTLQFLQELGQSQIARPLYFQNSFHNATAGFLSKVFHLTGPSLTVSHGAKSGLLAVETADILLESMTDYCLVVGVESSPSILPLSLREEFGLEVETGAALLLSRRGASQITTLTSLEQAAQTFKASHG